MRRERPDLSLTSDFIVGFPGETDADFAQTMDLIDAVGFDGSFSFAYSPRPGTPAAALPDHVPHDVQQARLSALQLRIDEQYRAHSEAMVGTRQRVLVTGVAARGENDLAGRTDTLIEQLSERIQVYAASRQLAEILDALEELVGARRRQLAAALHELERYQPSPKHGHRER